MSNSFYTNSQEDKIDDPRYLRKSEKSLKRLQKKVSRKNKGYNNRKKAINLVVPVAPQYTSQNCSNCGEIVKKSLSVRTHVCKCGCILDRDHNAAINILAKALKQTGYDLSTVGRTETSNACGEMTLCSDLVTSLNKVAR
jgi:putative transposase